MRKTRKQGKTVRKEEEEGESVTGWTTMLLKKGGE